MRTMFFIILFVLITLPLCLAATTTTLSVSATVLQGESSISTDTSTVNFGAVTGSETNRRFVAGPIKVSYFAGDSSWTIRVYTANAGNVVGLIGVTDSNYNIPLKVWCDNYGPSKNAVGQTPDEENKYFWNGYDFNSDGDKQDTITNGTISEISLGFDVNGDTDILDTGLGTGAEPVGEEPVWLRVPDYIEMDPGQPYTWRRLAYAGAELDAQGFPVYFGIDVTEMPSQDYRTTALTFQIINE